MGLTLSASDLDRLAEAQTVLMSPLRFRTEEDWGLAANRSIQPVLGADMVTCLLPGIGRPGFSDQFSSEELERYGPFYRRFQQQYDLCRRQVDAGVWNRAGIWPDRDNLYRTDYWDFLREVRAYDSLGMSVTRDGTPQPATLLCHHDRPTGRKFGQRGIALLRLLYPAFRTGVATLDHVDRRGEHLIRHLDALTTGAILVNPDGRVLHTNRALEALFDADPEGWRLRNRAPRVAAALADVSHRSTPLPTEEVLRTSIGSYRFSPSPLGEELLSSPAVLVTVTRSEPVPPEPEELAGHFGLTRRQAEVALLLARRLTNREIADRLVISPHTARHHTERVLRKLGVHRRSDVRRVLEDLAAH